jgi:hypothetical protein
MKGTITPSERKAPPLEERGFSLGDLLRLKRRHRIDMSPLQGGFCGAGTRSATHAADSLFTQFKASRPALNL